MTYLALKSYFFWVFLSDYQLGIFGLDIGGKKGHHLGLGLGLISFPNQV